MSFTDSELLAQIIEKEKFVLSAMLIREGECVPKVAAILSGDEFYRPKHRLTYRTILKIHSAGKPVHILNLVEEFQKTNLLDEIGIEFAYSLTEYAHTNAFVESYARDIKEQDTLRRLALEGEKIADAARKGILPAADIISASTANFNAITAVADQSRVTDFSSYFHHNFIPNVEDLRKYADRKTDFDNLDKAQFFSPGLYVLGATPAAGKTTFAWQLLQQLAANGEPCIFCSYEMSALELYSKSVARELFNADPFTKITAAAIRRGNITTDVLNTIELFINSNLPLKVIELRDESVDELLKLLRPMCTGVDKAPVVCIDYLQIIPTSQDAAKLGIDDTVRKLKKFQRDTNTTFIVISSFNRTNYLSSVSFESYKESGSIEYTADVVWGLQLHIMNQFKTGTDQARTRKKIEEAKKENPRKIELKCLKNRQGANYACYFNYFAANDTFVPCNGFSDEKKPASTVGKNSTLN